jgi:hypothetical protein
VRLKFVGGPYDGMEIDHTLLTPPIAVLQAEEGDLTDRLFVIMPESREVWEKLVRGEKVWVAFGSYYEKESSPNGDRYVSSSFDSWMRAKSEAKLKAHPRAQTAFAVLSAEDKKRVLEAAVTLQGLPPDRWPADQVRLIDKGKQLYLLRVTPELLAFIRIVGGGQIELNDIVRAEALRLFQEKYAAGVPQ